MALTKIQLDPDLQYLQQHGIHYLYDRLVEGLAVQRPTNVIDFMISSLQKERQRVYKLVVIRHGESTWNQENRFTGWTDVDLAGKGLQEANKAGQSLKDNGFDFDVAFCSTLKRAIRTLWITLDNLDQMYIPINKRWRLNERHYGALQGLDKAETAARHGEEQVKIWRRSYDVPPPSLDKSDARWPGHERKYSTVPSNLLPVTESLKDTVARVLPCWFEEIAPLILEGKNVLIVAHGNSLRALIKYLEDMSEAEILELNIPTGMPLVYELNGDLRPIRKYYLGSEEEIRKAQAAVAAQGKVKK
eukprot:NODE_4831_length_1106_cov_69.691760_g4290_i0.p1 GENE.NODE_4831_length_1106_cov_69.691760_g4290_i0~~NODE_4831_length_1106_cov_69.691760_g4290_i0.p1  ORF type:complete len:303 (+),score=61.98 NODE_4831_length_1106_cov_69.691760_g4290_i0:105-1013(+)